MKPDFSKMVGLVPAIIQDAQTMQVLMLGYMNEEAYTATLKYGFVTFYSRSKQRLWMKGETSGNKLKVAEILGDCDNDTLLIKVIPAGPVCHTGNANCFGQQGAKGFIYRLESIIRERIDSNSEGSYSNSLYRKGINKVAQKVGEEAVELVIEAMSNDIGLFKNEAADLLYHMLLLFKSKGLAFEDIEDVLGTR